MGKNKRTKHKNIQTIQNFSRCGYVQILKIIFHTASNHTLVIVPYVHTHYKIR